MSNDTHEIARILALEGGRFIRVLYVDSFYNDPTAGR